MIRNINLNTATFFLFSSLMFFYTIFVSNTILGDLLALDKNAVMAALSTLFLLSVFFYILFEKNKSLEKKQINPKRIEYLERLFDVSMDGMMVWENNGNIIYASPSCSDIYGFHAGENVLQKNFLSFYKNSEGFQDAIESMSKGEKTWKGECVFLKPDKSEIEHHIRIEKIDENKNICVVKRVCEKNNLEMIKIAMESATDGMAIVSNDNKLLFVNGSFLKIHGLKPQDRPSYIGSDWRDLYSLKGQENINSIVLPSTIIKGYWNGYLDVMRKDGVMFCGDASLTRLSSNLILGVMRDVTERRRIEKEREKIKEQMYQSKKSEAVTRLIKGMGGDFKNALSIIKDRAENAIRTEDIPQERRKYMTDIIVASDKANEMVDHIMNFSEGKNINATNIDIVNFVLNVNNKITRELKTKIKCVVDITVDSGRVFGDEGQIQKIILSVCENSIESFKNQTGHIVISLRDSDIEKVDMQDLLVVEDYQHKKDNDIPFLKSKDNRFYLLSGSMIKKKPYFRISVSDTGSGIYPEVLPNIFDPFFSTKNREKAAGLGLSSVHGTILSYDGAIMVESEVGVGTSVHLFFPQYNKDSNILNES